MGAWSVIMRRMPELVPEGIELGYVGRRPRASPGEGYAAPTPPGAGADRPHCPDGPAGLTSGAVNPPRHLLPDAGRRCPVNSGRAPGNSAAAKR